MSKIHWEPHNLVLDFSKTLETAGKAFTKSVMSALRLSVSALWVPLSTPFARSHPNMSTARSHKWMVMWNLTSVSRWILAAACKYSRATLKVSAQDGGSLFKKLKHVCNIKHFKTWKGDNLILLLVLIWMLNMWMELLILIWLYMYCGKLDALPASFHVC